MKIIWEKQLPEYLLRILEEEDSDLKFKEVKLTEIIKIDYNKIEKNYYDPLRRERTVPGT